jgi:hypothetical protein
MGFAPGTICAPGHANYVMEGEEQGRREEEFGGERRILLSGSVHLTSWINRVGTNFFAGIGKREGRRVPECGQDAEGGGKEEAGCQRPVKFLTPN